MAQFDVHRLAPGGQLVIDCQSDIHDHFDSRFVIPLILLQNSPPRAGRLHPVLAVDGSEYVLATQAATAVRKRDLGPTVTRLTAQRLDIVSALDVLITGV